MADDSGGNTGLALIVGILLAVVAIGGFFYFGAHPGGGGSGVPDKVTVDVKPPKTGG